MSHAIILSHLASFVRDLPVLKGQDLRIVTDCAKLAVEIMPDVHTIITLNALQNDDRALLSRNLSKATWAIRELIRMEKSNGVEQNVQIRKFIGELAYLHAQTEDETYKKEIKNALDELCEDIELKGNITLDRNNYIDNCHSVYLVPKVREICLERKEIDKAVSTKLDQAYLSPQRSTGARVLDTAIHIFSTPTTSTVPNPYISVCDALQMEEDHRRKDFLVLDHWDDKLMREAKLSPANLVDWESNLFYIGPKIDCITSYAVITPQVDEKLQVLAKDAQPEAVDVHYFLYKEDAESYCAEVERRLLKAIEKDKALEVIPKPQVKVDASPQVMKKALQDLRGEGSVATSTESGSLSDDGSPTEAVSESDTPSVPSL